MCGYTAVPEDGRTCCVVLYLFMFVCRTLIKITYLLIFLDSDSHTHGCHTLVNDRPTTFGTIRIWTTN